MTYPAFGAYGAYHGQMPMQMAMGQPVPRGVQTAVAHDGSTGYSVYSGAYAGAAVDPLWAFFSATAGQNGEVDAEELQRCLTQSGISGTYSRGGSSPSIQLGDLQNYDIDVRCHPMETVILYTKEQNWQDPSDFTKDCKQRQNTGKMGYNEFKELWTALSAWKHNFMLVDQDRSGTVEFHVLTQVIVAMGYRLSPQTLIAIVKRYSKNGRISFDDYVACCVKLRALTDFFRRRDSMQQGIVNLLYDDFLQCTMAI